VTGKKCLTLTRRVFSPTISDTKCDWSQCVQKCVAKMCLPLISREGNWHSYRGGNGSTKNDQRFFSFFILFGKKVPPQTYQDLCIIMFLLAPFFNYFWCIAEIYFTRDIIITFLSIPSIYPSTLSIISLLWTLQCPAWKIKSTLRS
jgi:hypothetical protein